jgi:hypothetical protein
MSMGEIRAQPLARLQLVRFDQSAAVAPTPAREPNQRAFSFVDDDAGAAEIGDDLALRQSEMLSAKAINNRL